MTNAEIDAASVKPDAVPVGTSELVRRLRDGPQTLNAKWLDPQCWDGCQSLVLKARAEQAGKLLQQMLDVAENADETGYVTDVGFVDLEKLHNEVRAFLQPNDGGQT